MNVGSAIVVALVEQTLETINIISQTTSFLIYFRCCIKGLAIYWTWRDLTCCGHGNTTRRGTTRTWNDGHYYGSYPYGVLYPRLDFIESHYTKITFGFNNREFQYLTGIFGKRKMNMLSGKQGQHLMAFLTSSMVWMVDVRSLKGSCSVGLVRKMLCCMRRHLYVFDVIFVFDVAFACYVMFTSDSCMWGNVGVCDAGFVCAISHCCIWRHIGVWRYLGVFHVTLVCETSPWCLTLPRCVLYVARTARLTSDWSLLTPVCCVRCQWTDNAKEVNAITLFFTDPQII